MDAESNPQSGPAPLDAPAKRPWWILHFFGPMPAAVSERNVQVLGAVAFALLFEEYDLAMLTAALPQIAASLQMAETDFGLYLGIIRLGALPAFALIPFADRIGRRRIFLVTLAGTGIATLLTAFTVESWQFVACQMATRTFFVTGSAIAFVMIAEEFPADHRGWGIGVLGALGAAGHGVAMLLFSQIDLLPYGWRALYAFGVIPLLLLPWFRRRLPETERFQRHADAQEGGSGSNYSMAPLIGLVRDYPARTLGIVLGTFLSSVGLVAAFQFTGYFTQTVHGWSPTQYALMVGIGGALGIAGSVAGGRFADRFGRRRVGVTLLGSVPFWVAVFYNGPSWVLPIAWVGFVFGSSGGRVILRALSTELFPTSQRASASGMFAIFDALGGSVGLLILYFGSVAAGDFVELTTLLALTVLLSACVVLFFPETGRRELESISE
ncbi:MAG: MFS transporter [bacterium]|nr:MFS transporter [bacterium]